MYYLLRDFDEERARKYAEKAMMPEHFCRLMDGMWFLDQLWFEVCLHTSLHYHPRYPTSQFFNESEMIY